MKTRDTQANILLHNIHIPQQNNYALIGISPFNSYFSTARIATITKWVDERFTDFGYFIPNDVSRYTFEALGYEPRRTRMKVKKQDNYTKNKILSALNMVFGEEKAKLYDDKIILLSTLSGNIKYQTSYNNILNKFNQDKDFHEGCINTTKNLLSSRYLANNLANEVLEKSAMYFISEAPILFNACEILNLDSCIFIYHSYPNFLKETISNADIVSANQYFLELDLPI